MSDAPDLKDRLAFMQLDASAARRLADAKPSLEAALPAALDAFYAKLAAEPQVRRFFSDQAHMTAAKGAQRRHWTRLASGTFDRDYAESVQRIGGVHARIGLEPRWYIGGYALILSELVSAVVKEDARRRGLFGRRRAAAALADRLSAVIKAAMLDMDLSISVYLDASEAARREAERQQTHVVQATAVGLSALAAGDFTHRIEGAFPGGYEKLRCDFNSAVAQLQEAMQDIAANAGGMAGGVGEIRDATDDLSHRTEQQAAAVEETAAALEQITVTVRRTADAARSAREVVSVAGADAERSGEVVDRAISAMNVIEKSAGEISKIIGVIDEIAFQTNLLALNAGVEAARAGDAGRGFAVVASEVRALAQRSAEAAKEIKALISASAEQVNQGVDLVGRAGQTLTRIAGQVEQITALVTDIAASAQEQSAGLQQVNVAMGQMDQVTQQNAAMVEETTAASRSLAREAAVLSALVGRFRVGLGSADEVRGPAARVA